MIPVGVGLEDSPLLHQTPTRLDTPATASFPQYPIQGTSGAIAMAYDTATKKRLSGWRRNNMKSGVQVICVCHMKDNNIGEQRGQIKLTTSRSW